MPQKLHTPLERPQDLLAEQEAALKVAATQSLIAWKHRQQAQEDAAGQSYTLEQTRQHHRTQQAFEKQMREQAREQPDAQAGIHARSSGQTLARAPAERGSRRVTQAEALERHLAAKFARVDGESGHDLTDSRGIVARLGTARTLEPAVQEMLEGHLQREGLDADLSSLKVHPDSDLAQHYQAKALVKGGEIHFAPGQFDSGTLEGQQLLVHEAVHAVQQAQGRTPEGMDQDPALEGEAERVASNLTVKASSDPKAWFAQAETLFKGYRSDPEKEGREARLLERLDALPDVERSKVLSRVQQKLRPFERELLEGAKESGAVASTPVLEAPLPSVVPLNTRSTGILYTYGLKRASLSRVRPTASQHAAPSPVPLGEGWQKQLERSPLHDAALSWRGQVSKHLAPTPRQLEITNIPSQVPSRERLFKEITGYAPPKAPTGAWGLRDIRRAAQQDPKKLEEMSRGFDSKAMLEKQARLRGALENATREAGVETDPFKRVLNDFGLQVGSAVEAFYARPELHMLAHEMRELRTHEMSSDKRYGAQSVEKSGFADSLEKELEGLGQAGNRVKVGSGNSNAVQRKASIQSGQKLSADPAAPLSSLAKAHLSEMLSKYPSSSQEAGNALNTARAELPKTTPALQTPTGLSPKGGLGAALEPGSASNPQIKGGLEAALTPIVEGGIAAQTGVVQAVAEGKISFGLLGFMQGAIAGMVGDQIQTRTAEFEAEKQGAVAAAQTEEEKTRIKNAQIRVQGKDVGAVQGAIDQIDTNSGTKTCPDQVPAPQLEGELDPAQMDREAETQEKDVAARSSEEEVKSAVERGENDLFPQARAGTLEGKHSGGAGASIAPVKLEDPGLPGEVWPLADQIHDPVLQPKLDAEAQKAQSAKVDLDAKVGASQSEAEAKIEAADARTEAAQLERQKATQQQVDGAKLEWKKEIGGVKEQYQKDAQKEVGSRNDSIKSKQKEADKKADDEYARGEREAEAKRVEKEKEAQQAKENKKKEAKSFWDSLCGAIQSFFNAVVSLVNAIFDALRAAVKAIFAAVKAAVTFIFDTLKTVITGIISALGEVLKGLVTIALAAFPEIAKKWCEAIDGFVKSANTFIEEQVDSLRDEIIGYLDSAAELIDLGLGIAQGVITAGIESMGYLIRGDLEGAGKAVIRNLLIHLGEFGVRLWGLIETAWEAFKKDPLGFVGMIFSIIGQGFAQFFDHIGEHLKKGLIGWLSGQMSTAGIILPKELNLAGVAMLTLQILGITPELFRKNLVTSLGKDGEQKVKLLEDGWEWFVGFRDKGLAFLGEKLGEFLHNWQSKFIGIAVDYVRNELIARAVVEVTKMMVPIAGWIAGLQKLIQTIKFVVQILSDVFGAIGEALKGNPKKAIDLVEGALSNQVPRAIDWLAGLIGFKDLGAKIRKALEGLRSWVEDGIKKLVDWVVNAPGVRQILKVVGVEETDKEDHDEWVIKGKELLEADIAAYSGELDLDAGKAIAAKANSSKVKGWREEMRTYGIYKSLKAVSIADAKTAWNSAGALEQGKRYNAGAGEALEEAEFAFVGEASRVIVPVKVGKKTVKGMAILKVGAVFGKDFHVYSSPEKKEKNIIKHSIPVGDMFWVESELTSPIGWYKVSTQYGSSRSLEKFKGPDGEIYRKETLQNPKTLTGFVDKSLIRLPPSMIDQDIELKMLLTPEKKTPVNLVAEAYDFTPASLFDRKDNDKIHQYVRLMSLLNPKVFVGGAGKEWWNIKLNAGMYYWLPGKETAKQVIKDYNIPKSSFTEDVGSYSVGKGKELLLNYLKDRPNGGEVLQFIKKAGSTLQKIWDDPGAFLGHLTDAVNGGFEMFQSNFGSHLKSSFIQIVVGKTGIQLPPIKDLTTPTGAINFGLGVLGLNSEGLKARLQKKFPRVPLNAVEGLVGKVQKEGLQKTLETESKDLGTRLLQMGYNSFKEWAFTQVVKEGVKFIASVFVPGGAILVVIEKIYKTVMFVIQKINEIEALLKTITSAVSRIADGDISQAIKNIDGVLGKGLTLALEFLLKLLNLDNLTNKIKEVVGKIGTFIDGLLQKLLSKFTGKPVTNPKPGEETPAPSSELTAAQKIKTINTAKGEADSLVAQSDDALDLDLVQGVVAIKSKHKLTKASVEEDSDEFWVHLELNPTGNSKRKKSQLKLAIGEAVVEMQKSGATAAEVEAALPGIARTYKLQSLELESKSGGQYQVKGQLKDSSSGKLITRSSVAMKLGSGSSARVTNVDIEGTKWHTAAKTKAKNLLKADTALSLKTLLDLHTKIKTTDLYLKPLNVDIGAFSTDMRDNIAEPATKNAVTAVKAAWKTAGKTLEPTQQQVLDRPEDTIITSAVRGTFNSEPAKKPFLKAKDLFRTILFDNQAPPRTAASSGFEPEMQDYLEGALEEAKPHQEYKIVESSVQDQSDPNQPNTSTISFDTVTGAKYTVTWIDHNRNKIIQNSKGEYLALKDWKNITGRGTLQQGGKPKNAGLDAAHVIADQFTGTGYELFKGKQKRDANVIYTSAKFNQETMVAAERDIERFVVTEKDKEEARRGGKDISMFFNMGVDIDWEEINPDVDDKIIADIKADIDGGRTKHYEDLKGKTLAEIKAEVLATFTKYGLPEKLQRVSRITYDATLKDVSNFNVKLTPSARTADDTWLGLIPAYQKKKVP